MPNWKVHLEIAKRICEEIKYTQKEQEEFYLGNILPDINNGYIITDISKKLEHKYTHYQDEKEVPSYINFKNICENKIYNEPLIFGYYTHLYTDYTWNNYFYTKYNNHEKLQNLTHDEKRKIKQDDFKAYNDLFIENRVSFPDKSKLAKKAKEIERISITKEDIEKVEAFLNNQEKSNYKFNILSKEILDRLMNQTVEEMNGEFLNKN